MDVTVSPIRDNDGTIHLANSIVLLIGHVNRLSEHMLRVRFEDGHVYLLHSDEIQQVMNHVALEQNNRLKRHEQIMPGEHRMNINTLNASTIRTHRTN
jgi:hypothetical protein